MKVKVLRGTKDQKGIFLVQLINYVHVQFNANFLTDILIFILREQKSYLNIVYFLELTLGLKITELSSRAKQALEKFEGGSLVV